MPTLAILVGSSLKKIKNALRKMQRSIVVSGKERLHGKVLL